jgi:hypothetical protein
MGQFIPFPNVTIISESNPNIQLGVIHFRYESLLQGCERVADEYRSKETNRGVWNQIKFYINHDGNILVDNKGKRIKI